jgi:glucose/arabinose dehydrogenase/cytochrome c2
MRAMRSLLSTVDRGLGRRLGRRLGYRLGRGLVAGLTLGALVVFGGTTQAAPSAAAAAGEALYKQRCGVCHPVDNGSAQGPGLGRIIGRRAASLATFGGYSPALRAYKQTWSDATLDKFLTAPNDVVPGTLMPIPTPDDGERHAIIAYLHTLHDDHKPAPSAANKPAIPAAAAEPVNVGKVRQDKAAFGDYRDDAPGVRRHITVAALPPPFATDSSSNGPRVVPAPPHATLRVPAGFTVTPFAHGLDRPRALRAAPNGDIFITESEAGRVRVIRAKDGASAPEQLETFASKLDRPFGVAFYPPGPSPRFVYVAENNRVIRYPYGSGDLHARGPAETIVPKLTDGSEGHWTRDLAFSADGKQLFVSVGSGSNIADGMSRRPPTELAAWEKAEGLGATWGDERHRADVLVFDPEGKGGKVFASGIRNCVGLAVQPETHALWCSTNERDGLGDNLVPDYVTQVRAGAYYGWPWYYLGAHEDPRLKGARPDLAGKATVPDVLLEAHSASLEMTFYDGNSFPAAYRGDGFAALHGSWNRATRTGYKVVRIRTEHGVPTGEYEDFLVGFVVDQGHVWGRPVGVAVAHDGSLLVSEDGNGTIWRVSYTGH